jgi:hypothetical protein
MKPMDTLAKRERSLVSAFTGMSSTRHRSALMKKPKVATKIDAPRSQKFPRRMFAQTSANATSASAHQSRRTVTMSPKRALPQCFTTRCVPVERARPCLEPRAPAP